MNRSDEIENRIGSIQGVLLEAYHHHNSGFIADKIQELTNLQVTYKDFENYTEKAVEIRQDILDKLKLLLAKTMAKKKPYSLEDIKKIVEQPKERVFNERMSHVTYYI